MPRPEMTQLAQYALMNVSTRILDEFFDLLDSRGHSYALAQMAEKLLRIINKPIFPAVLYAVAHDIAVEDFYRALIDANDQKLLYYISKLLNSKTRSFQVMEEMDKLMKMAKTFGMLPVFNRLKLPDIDYYFYGDGLAPHDYSSIWGDFKNRMEQEDITIPTDPELCGILFGEVAAEYGIHPTVLAIKTEDPQIRAEALKIRDQIRQQRLAEAAILKQEEALLQELEQLELETLRVAEQRSEQERQLRKATSERLRKSESERLPKIRETELPKKKYLFIVGGLSSDIPAWIKNAFEIKHAAGHSMGGERVAKMLGDRLPDAVLVMKYASHTLTTPATDLARKHRIPILIARPSISTAVKKAAEYGPAWFAEAYPKSLRNPQ